MHSVRKVQLPLAGFKELVHEASAEGYPFLATAEHEWTTGENRFSRPGEALYAVFAHSSEADPEQHRDQDQLVAVGALGQDPYLTTPGTGRLRRIYVRALWRRQGIGALLVATMLADARPFFSTVRLRADNPSAARLYEALGFIPQVEEHATHILHFAL